MLISRALLTKTELCIREGHLTNKTSIAEEMEQIHDYQKAAFLFWKDDHSYRPNSEMYGPEAKDLIREMSRIKTQYLDNLKE